MCRKQENEGTVFAGKGIVSLRAGGRGAFVLPRGPVLTKAGHGVRDTSFKGIGRVQV